MSELDERFSKLFKLAREHIPERRIEHLTLYPAGRQVEPYIPKPVLKQAEEAPKYTPGPRKLTLEEYLQRNKKPHQQPKKKNRGGRQKQLAKEAEYYKLRAAVAESEEEAKRFLELSSQKKKEVNRLKHKKKKIFDN